MPCQDYIDVRVIADNEVLPEYRNPYDDTGPSDSRICYIEAKADQIFKVRVTWMAGFHLRHAPYLNCHIEFDNDTCSFQQPSSTQNLIHHRGVLASDLSVQLATTCLRNDVTSPWEECAYTFGILRITDGPNSDSLTTKDIESLGRIRVSCYRARSVNDRATFIFDGIRKNKIEAVPEYLLKGRDVKNIVKHTPVAPVLPPLPSTRLEPIKGFHGKISRFTFRYRDKKFLQAKGFIPRSPTPEPDPSILLGRAQSILELTEKRKREVEELLKKLNNKKRGRSASPKIGASTTTTKSEGDDFVIIAPPPRRVRELIDLTGDSE